MPRYRVKVQATVVVEFEREIDAGSADEAIEIGGNVKCADIPQDAAWCDVENVYTVEVNEVSFQERKTP